MTPAVILDDATLSNDLQLVGRQWSTSASAHASYRNTLSVCRSELSDVNDTSRQDPYIAVKFSGKSAPLCCDLNSTKAFTGTEITLIGTSSANTAASYSIDGSDIQTATLHTGKEDPGKV